MTLGTVYLVGAGPGAADLLTIRALRTIEAAQVVLYDRLVGDDVLALIPGTCRKVFVGKLPQEDSRTRQERIHTMLIGFAREGLQVVRLKGGDPFVFGRGGEELLYLRAAGIPCEIVPGISSCVAGPAAAMIPVTHRDTASSFGVFAGHPGEGVRNGGVDWEAAARINTAIFLMGVARLPIIVDRLMRHGRSAQTPVAVVANATRADQNTVTGTLADIVNKAAGVGSPAVIVVGDVAAFPAALARAESQWLSVEASAYAG